MKPILELKNINYAYHTPEGETPALRDVSFSLAPGGFTAVVESVRLREIHTALSDCRTHGSRIGRHLFKWKTAYRKCVRHRLYAAA